MTIASMGCHPLSVITALTVQDTSGVHDLLPLEPDWVERQTRTILNDIPVHAFKLGLLGSDAIINVIAEILLDYPDIPVVMDPVLASGRGDELTTEIMIKSIRKLLLPRVTLLTPNSLEARRLAFADEVDTASSHSHSLDACASRLLDTGCDFVLITGTHEHTAQVTNSLYTRGRLIRTDNWKRLPHSYHGSGCTLASAIAASIASGQTIIDSVIAAQSYTWGALSAGFQPGLGQYIPDRHFRNSIKEQTTCTQQNIEEQ